MVVVVLLHMARVFFTAAYRQRRGVQLAHRHGAPGDDARPVVHRLPAAVGPARLLGDHDRREHRAVAARSDRRAEHHRPLRPGRIPDGTCSSAPTPSARRRSSASTSCTSCSCRSSSRRLLAVHFWRIRKDGGLARPADADARARAAPADRLAARLHRCPAQDLPPRGARAREDAGRRARARRTPCPRCRTCSTRELAVFMLTVAGLPRARRSCRTRRSRSWPTPACPRTRPRRRGTSSGLQELVSFSAFMGGIGIPTIVLLGLGLIPFLDREKQGTGEWFGGPGGRRLVVQAAGVGLALDAVDRGARDSLRVDPRVVPAHPAARHHVPEPRHGPDGRLTRRIRCGS